MTDEEIRQRYDAMAETDRQEALVFLAEQVSGLHYEDPHAQAIMDIGDWSEFWPLIDGDGTLGGGIVGSGVDGWHNVNDMAAIMDEDLPPGARVDEPDDGYVAGIPAYSDGQC